MYLHLFSIVDGTKSLRGEAVGICFQIQRIINCSKESLTPNSLLHGGLACNLSNQCFPSCYSVKSKIKEIFILRQNITLSRKDMQVLSIFFTYALGVNYCPKLTILRDEK